MSEPVRSGDVILVQSSTMADKDQYAVMPAPVNDYTPHGKYHVMIRLARHDGSFSEWESSLSGTASSPEQAVVNFVERQGPMWIHKDRVIWMHPLIAETIEKLHAAAAARQAVEEQARVARDSQSSINAEYRRVVDAVKLPPGKKGKLTFSNTSGGTTEVDATYYGSVWAIYSHAVYKDKKYSLTHVPSGYAAGDGMDRWQAVLFLKALIHSGLDYSDRDIKKWAPNARNVAHQISAFVKGVGKAPEYYVKSNPAGVVTHFRRGIPEYVVHYGERGTHYSKHSTFGTKEEAMAFKATRPKNPMIHRASNPKVKFGPAWTMTSGEFVEKLNHSNPSWDNPAYFGDLEFTSWAGNYLTGPLFSPVSLAVLGPIYHHNVDSKTIHADQVELALKNGVSVSEHVLSSVVRPVKYHEFDFAHLIGKRYRSHDGHDWEVVGQSSTHIPYVRKVVRGKATGKTFFCDYQSWYRLYFGEPEKISTGDVRVNPMVNVHPLAIEARKRYRDDLKAGHTAATEYWRGQAGAFFTGNPLDSHNPYVSGYPSRYPVVGDIVRFIGLDKYGTVAHVSSDGERVMVYWGEGAMEAKPVESSKLVLVSRSGGQNPIMETIGTAAITGIGLGAGFKMVDGLVNKAKSVIKNPRTLPPLMRGTMEKTYDCGCVMSGTAGRTQFCATARGLLGQQAKARKAYKGSPTQENKERLTRADLAFEKHYHFRRTSA